RVDELDGDVLRPVEVLLGDATASRGQKAEATIVLDGGIRGDAAQQGDLLRLVARLLDQLAACGLERVLAIVDDPTWNFECGFTRAVPVLAYAHELAVRRQRDDVDPVVRLDDEEVIVLAADRRGHVVLAHVEHTIISARPATVSLPRFDHALMLNRAPNRL